jgi:hypothetical protein
MAKFKVNVIATLTLYGQIELEGDSWQEVYDEVYDKIEAYTNAFDEVEEPAVMSVFPSEIRDCIRWQDDGENGKLYIDDLYIYEDD